MMIGASLRERTLSGLRWTAAARIGLQLITWPVTLVVIRLLEPGDYGLLAMATVVIGFIALFSELGLGVALVQAREVNVITARAASAVIVGLNVSVALVLVLVAPWIAGWFEAPELATIIVVLTLELIIGALAVVPHAMLERQLRFRELSIAVMAATLCGVTCTLTGALLGFGVWSLVMGTLTQALVRSVLVIAYHGGVVWPLLSQGLGPVLPLVNFSGHVIGARALWYWYAQADQVILGRLLHATLLGYYSVAAQLAMLPVSKAMDTINKVAIPVLSRLSGEPLRLQQWYQRLLSLIAVYGIGTCWGLAAVAEEFVHLALNSKWDFAATPLALLALAAPLRLLCVFQNTVVTAAGVPSAATLELAIASVVMPAAILAGAVSHGLNGAAVAWVLAFPVVYLVSTKLTSAALGLRLRDGLRPLAAPLLSGALMVAGVWFVKQQLGRQYGLLPLFAIEVVAGAVLYGLAMQLLAPAVVRDGRRLISDLAHPGRGPA
jgi:teichuronic acid exporter